MSDSSKPLPIRGENTGDQLPLQESAPDPETQGDLAATVAAKEARKVEARNEEERSIWFGLGTFGMIGWSVAVPAIACVALGVWIDSRWPSRYSWTLMLLVVGVGLGCLNAWFWLTRERRNLR